MSKLYYPGYQTRVWNPFVGSDHGAAKGCLPKCWAAAMVRRWGDQWGIGNSFAPRLVEKWLRKPLSWRKPQVVATGFMGDIACLPPVQLASVMATIQTARQHTYLLLTKDPERLRKNLLAYPRMPPNVILGATVRNQEDADALIPALLRIPAARYWLSIEPLLGPIVRPKCPHCHGRKDRQVEDSCYSGQATCPDCGGTGAAWPLFDWAVIGSESGRGADWGGYETPGAGEPRTTVRHAVIAWTRSLVAQCRAAGVAVWVKQLPHYRDGKWRVSGELADFPADLQVREKPF